MLKHLGLWLAAALVCLTSSANVRAQQDFDRFWTKFSTAVRVKDKNTVARLTRFPLKDESENDEGPNPTYSRAGLYRKFDYFFDRSVRQCFLRPEFYLNNNDPTEKIITCRRSRYIQISFMFKRYRTGWKWINFNRD